MILPGKNKAAKKGFPVVITSYEIVMADLKFLQQFEWKYIIVDEGHRLKNWNCKLLRELRTLRAGNKMILSGTAPYGLRHLPYLLLKAPTACSASGHQE